uniref:hypothetical protein n=1 Tax=Mycobacterium sp. P7213 TaxID=2478465 RepID=UPI001F15508B|nr:hypothetical protein [Mycobacterium sp. P7213]
MHARRSRAEGIAEVLGLARDFAVHELHHAHHVGRPTVVGEDEFTDPQIATAQDAADREAFGVRLSLPRRLNAVAATNPLTRLGVFEDRIGPVDPVFGVEVVRILGRPVRHERGADAGVIGHANDGIGFSPDWDQSDRMPEPHPVTR